MQPIAVPTTLLLLTAATAQVVEAEPARPPVVAKRVYAAQANFDRPLWVGFHASEPEAFVVEQPGRISRVPRDDASAERTLFADLTERVYSEDFWEEGLLGFAFDPEYERNGLVYLYYTEKTPLQVGEVRAGRQTKSTRQSVLARYRTMPGEAGARVLDPASEFRIMTVFQPFPNHNGGTIVFGPDNMLYVALGDGGLARDPFRVAQDKRSLLGKVLRIDVRGATAEQPYSIPEDNPFVTEPEARGEIWCYGLRNPWRIAFDRETGDLWCGDVGQDRIEEVDLLRKGGNYGWSWMEGSERMREKGELPEGLLPPVAEYDHGAGVSVTGGFVYRGAAIPQLVGSYVYGDFATFRIWAVRPDGEGEQRVREIGRAPAQLSSFAEEPDGELLITCFDGKIYRLVPSSDDG